MPVSIMFGNSFLIYFSSVFCHDGATCENNWYYPRCYSFSGHGCSDTTFLLSVCLFVCFFTMGGFILGRNKLIRVMINKGDGCRGLMENSG